MQIKTLSAMKKQGEKHISKKIAQVDTGSERIHSSKSSIEMKKIKDAAPVL